MEQNRPGQAADAAVLLAEANRVMDLRRAEPFNPWAVSRLTLDLSCFNWAGRQDGSLDLDTLLTQRHRLRLLARAQRSGALDRLEGETRERCQALLDLAPAYQRCVKAVLAMHSLSFGDEGGMELSDADPDRASLRQELETGLKQLNRSGADMPPRRKEQAMIRDPFDFNNDGKVDADEELMGLLILDQCRQEAEEEDTDELFDDEENDLI